MSNLTYIDASIQKDKPLVWIHSEIKTPPFSQEARLETGGLLRRLQRGERLSMPSSRPMPSVGKHCHELRILDRVAVWRLVYRIDPDAIVILGVFQKKTRRTPGSLVSLCKGRIRMYDSIANE